MFYNELLKVGFENTQTKIDSLPNMLFLYKFLVAANCKNLLILLYHHQICYHCNLDYVNQILKIILRPMVYLMYNQLLLLIQHSPDPGGYLLFRKCMH